MSESSDGDRGLQALENRLLRRARGGAVADRDQLGVEAARMADFDDSDEIAYLAESAIPRGETNAVCRSDANEEKRAI
jgi:hypothetical protein